MIKVEKKYNNPPSILKGESCMGIIRELLERSEKTTNHKFYDYYYAHETVRETLNSLYHDKCAYCESGTRATAELRIDHYRPKSEVRHTNKKKRKPQRPGYYWLAYEWSNLVPTCEKCNLAKSSFFPIAHEKKRVKEHSFDEEGNLDCLATSDIFQDEKPYMLHPEIDEPEKHIIFLPNGSVKERTERGKWTIQICKLNRKKLILERKKIIDDFRNEFEDKIKMLAKHENSKEAIKDSFYQLFQKILFKTSSKKTFSRLGVFMFVKFELFFVEPLKRKIIKDEKLINQLINLLRDALDSFKKEHQ